MDYPKEGSTSLYDYSDKSIQQAGYAAVAYALINAATTGLTWIQAPSTPLLAIAITAVFFCVVFGGLAFGIFRKSRVAVVVMLILVAGLQLMTWFVLHSTAGSILSIIVTGFLLRGARRIFQDHAERAQGGT